MDTPERLYDAPSSRYVADFVGKINFLPAEVIALTKDSVTCRLTDMESPTLIRCPGPSEFQPGQRVIVGVRPEYLRACPGAIDPGHLHGRLERDDSWQLPVRVRSCVRNSPVDDFDPQRAGVVGKDCSIELDEAHAIAFAEDRQCRSVGVATWSESSSCPAPTENT